MRSILFRTGDTHLFSPCSACRRRRQQTGCSSAAPAMQIQPRRLQTMTRTRRDTSAHRRERQQTGRSSAAPATQIQPRSTTRIDHHLANVRLHQPHLHCTGVHKPVSQLILQRMLPLAEWPPPLQLRAEGEYYLAQYIVNWYSMLLTSGAPEDQSSATERT